MSDVVESGRNIRMLTVVDAYTRECLALEVDTSLQAGGSSGFWIGSLRLDASQSAFALTMVRS